MKLTLLGATGKTGLAIVSQALEAGDLVTALVRNPDGLTPQANLTIVVGDVTIADDVAKASQGADVVISALGAMGGSLMTDAVTAVISAAKETGVKRFILMSSFAVHKEQLSGGMKFLSGLVMGAMVKDKSASETLLRSSDLDWTIVYATGLTNGTTGAPIKVLGAAETISMKNKIARGDVAAWILKEAHTNGYRKANVTISQ